MLGIKLETIVWLHIPYDAAQIAHVGGERKGRMAGLLFVDEEGILAGWIGPIDNGLIILTKQAAKDGWIHGTKINLTNFVCNSHMESRLDINRCSFEKFPNTIFQVTRVKVFQ
jgi:hypothetical protein